MKIKIITLFNKIANNEKVPKKIKFRGETYYYSDADKFYYQNGFSMYRDFYWGGNCLNDEVEIIEEEKKIEKINYEEHIGIDLSEAVCNKINELVDEINKLKREKKR